MNILYINHYAGSIHHGMEYRPYYLAREWARQGHTVTIVAGSYSHVRQRNPDFKDPILLPIQNFLAEHYVQQNIDGINYLWCKTPSYSENGIMRVVNIFCFLHRLRKLRKYFKTQKIDMVIASSTYPFDTKVASAIAYEHNAKFVYEVHDLWPLTPMELGGMSKYHPFIWLMQRAENFAYKNADKVVSLLPQAKAYMQKHGMAENKFTYIPNGVAIADWQSKHDDLDAELQAKLTLFKQQHHFLIGYAGGMGEANALDFLLDAAKKLLELANDIGMVLVGDGPLKAKLLERQKQENLTNILILPAIKKNQIPEFLSQMDGLYIGWNNLPIYRFGICPNKLFDYMLSAKPIIHSVTAGNDLVKEANCGLSIPAEDVEAITAAILKMSKLNDQERAVIGGNGLYYVIKHHDYVVLAKQFMS